MIQIYTGEGKGKTTAAVGLCIRASKTMKVLFLQLIKNGQSSEIGILEKLPNITVRTYGSGERIYPKNANQKEKDLIKKGIEYLNKNYGKFDLIVIDEAITAVTLRLLPENELIELLKNISKNREIVLTGRNAPRGIKEIADLVTEMKKVKHYYDKGVKARKGIEY